MIYYICPKHFRHINWAPDDPSAPRLCGWEGCGTLLVYHPIHQYVYRKAEMRRAIDLRPIGRSVVVDQSGLVTPQSKQEKQEKVDEPNSNMPLETPITTMSNPFTLNLQQPQQEQKEQEDAPKESKVVLMSSSVMDVQGEEFGGFSFKPVLKESDSQAQLYEVLESKGYLFLCRDGEFRKFKTPTPFMLADETVPEPGVVSGGYCMHRQNKGCIMGRDDKLSDKTFYGKGEISYPDYIVYKSSIVFSLELKTPRGRSFKKYLAEHFYQEVVFSSGRSIVDELEARRRLTHRNVEICLLFDIRNVDDDDQVMTDLKNNIKSRIDRRNWWELNINGVIFYRTSGLTKRFTIGEILGGQSMGSSSQQMGLGSFFSKKEGV